MLDLYLKFRLVVEVISYGIGLVMALLMLAYWFMDKKR